MVTLLLQSVIYRILPEKYVQVRSKASKDVPPGMELCDYSNTRGKYLSTGSETKMTVDSWQMTLVQNSVSIV